MSIIRSNSIFAIAVILISLLLITQVGSRTINATIPPVVMNQTKTASIVWSDDFEDGNYDGWTVVRGSYDASGGIMTGTTTGWNWAIHNNTIAYGTWSLDLYYIGPADVSIWYVEHNADPYNYDNPSEGYFTRFNAVTGYITLERQIGGSQTVLDTYTPADISGWWHIVTVRDLEGNIGVTLNDTLCLDTQDIYYTSSTYFRLQFFNNPGVHAADNIIVEDLAVTTTTTTSTSTTESTSTTTTSSSTTTTSTTTRSIWQYIIENPVIFAALITGVLGIIAALIR